jgi:hypothetical protein
MAGSFTFHNKFHRANHHSVTSSDIADSGLDPIASKDYPFNGIFYNVITDENKTFFIESNSAEWYSAQTTMFSNSSNWMLTRTLYNTVSSLSGNWNLGFLGYTLLTANSGKWDSTNTTVSTFSAEWGSPFLMFTNKPQIYTHSKTFSGQNLRLNTSYPGLSTLDWDLNTQQVAFLTLDKNMFLLNPLSETMLNGGLYTLVITQRNDGVAGNGYELEFDKQYRFNSVQTFTNIVNKTLSGITIIDFINFNGFMLGDVTFLNGNFV